MRPARPAALIVALALLAACVPAPQRVPETVEAAAAVPASPAALAWFADVSAMADAEPVAGRRDVIQQRLDALAITWRVEPFAFNGADGKLIQQGENVLADIAGAADAPLLLIGAHFDRVARGRGATDNASGSAAVLALGERFKQRPLAHHRVAIAFWDLEERGLVGARAFVARGGPAPALYVNVDVFGWGDTLWMMAPDPADALVDASRAASHAAGLQLSAGAQYPPTDHRAFLEAGLPAVSYALVDSGEITSVLAAYAGTRPTTMPKVMRVIHTAEDTVARIDANAAARGVDALEDALRRWDAVAAATTTTSANR